MTRRQTDSKRIDRRRVLAVLSGVGLAALAGCPGDGDAGDQDGQDGTTETTTPTQTPTATQTPTPAPIDPEQTAKLAASAGSNVSLFGTSVAVSTDGRTALVGASTDDTSNGADIGPSYVFARSGENWTREAALAAEDGDPGDNFGDSVALSGDGTTAVIGARWDDDPNGDFAGSAYVFGGTNGDWTQEAKLVPADGDSEDKFGGEVALSADGTTLCVGAPGDEDPNGAGSVYVFDGTDGDWTQVAKLAPDDGNSGDVFGSSVEVSADGTTVLVGAVGEEAPNGERAGAAYVFDSTTGEWSQQTKLVPDDGDSEDAFGVSGALSGDGTTAVVGAYRDGDPNGDEAGSAYVFDGGGGEWNQQAKLVPDDGDAEDWFGVSTALSSDGETVLVGAEDDEDPNGDDAGSAYVFDRGADEWSQQIKLVPDDGSPDAHFGAEVALSDGGRIALIGATFDEQPEGYDSGSAYVFQLR